jgi:hypothetical protein
MADDLVKRLREKCACNIDSTPCGSEDDCRDAIAAADRIEALERERDDAVINRAAWELAAREAALDALAAAGQAQEAYEAQLKAEAERDEAKAMQECGCAYENPTDICAGHHALFERVYGVQRAALEARLEAARADAKEAEAYAEELEAKVKNLTKHHSNTADPRYWEGRYRDEKAALAKAVEALREIAAEASVRVETKKRGGISHKKLYKGWRKIATDRIDIARDALDEIGGRDG